MGDRIIQGSTNGVLARIEKTWLIGHSLGAHYNGYTAQYVFDKTNQKFYYILSMDPAGPFFQAENRSGRCQGMHKHDEFVHNSTAIYTNPNFLGTSNYNIAKVKILSNSKEKFCQKGCKNCDAICCHSYAPQFIFDKLIRKTPILAKYLDENDEPLRKLTIFNLMENGFYDLAPDYNPGIFDKTHEEL